MHDLQQDISQMVQALGYQLVDLQQNTSNKTLRFTVIIYKKDGIGSDDCDTVIRTLLPHVQALAQPQYVQMTVSTPGADRIFKHTHEYPIFVGKLVYIYLKDGSVCQGILQSADEQHIEVNGTSINYDDIAKGRLHIEI